MQIVKPNTKTPDPETAFKICNLMVERGIMLFSPVGKATIKICPPLCITKEQIDEAVSVLNKCIGEFS